MSFLAVGAGVGAATGLFKIGQGIHQNRLARSIEVPEADYKTSPYAIAMLGDAKRLLNSQMPGEQEAERSIYGAQGNTTSAVQRNATSGAQALAMLAATQGNANSAFNDLRRQQQEYAMRMLANMNQANSAMVNEGDKEYQSDLRKREEAIGEKNALRGAGTQNMGNGLNDLTNYAFLYNIMGNGTPGTKEAPSFF